MSPYYFSEMENLRNWGATFESDLIQQTNSAVDSEAEEELTEGDDPFSRGQKMALQALRIQKKQLLLQKQEIEGAEMRKVNIKNGVVIPLCGLSVGSVGTAAFFAADFFSSAAIVYPILLGSGALVSLGVMGAIYGSIHWLQQGVFYGCDPASIREDEQYSSRCDTSDLIEQIYLIKKQIKCLKSEECRNFFTENDVEKNLPLLNNNYFAEYLQICLQGDTIEKKRSALREKFEIRS